MSVKKSLSLCMIVKNEEPQIAECLESVKSIIDEIIIIDTGSTDQTKEIVKNYTYKIFDFNWTNNFSEARNFSLSKATSDWILVLDADETIHPADLSSLKNLITDTRFDAFRLTFKTFSNDDTHMEWQPATKDEISNYKVKGWFPMYKTRLFKNDPKIQFTGIVHETIEPSLAKNKLKMGYTDIVPLHFGFIHEQDNKHKMYFQLGLEKIKEDPKNPQNYYELGVCYYRNNQFEEAEKYLKSALRRKSDLHGARLTLADMFSQTDQTDKAIYHLKKAISNGAEDPVFFNNLANAYLDQNKHKAATAHYQKAIKLNPNYTKGITNWAICLMREEKFEESKKLFKRSLEVSPGNFIAHLNLGFIESRLGNIQNALQHYLNAYEIEPGNIKVLQNLGNTYYRLKYLKKSVYFFGLILKEQPENMVARNNVNALNEILKGNQ